MKIFIFISFYLEMSKIFSNFVAQSVAKILEYDT